MINKSCSSWNEQGDSCESDVNPFDTSKRSIRFEFEDQK